MSQGDQELPPHPDWEPPDLPPGTACSWPESPEPGYLYRPNELLVTVDGVDLAVGYLNFRGLGNEAEAFPDLGVTRLRVDTDTPLPSLVTELRGVPGIRNASVSPNHVMYLSRHWIFLNATPPVPAAAMGEQENRQPGDGVTVAVVDSGAADHPWFDGRVEIVGQPEGPDENGNDKLDLSAGHGTFVCGLVLQHAPGARVVAIRFPTERNGIDLIDDLALAQALLDLDDDTDIVNLSLGGTTHGDTEPPATASAVAQLRARDRECVIVAAAGNRGGVRQIWPAALKGVVAVGATDGTSPWPYSGRGPWLDVWAEGVNAHSTFLEWSGELEHPASPGAQEFEGWATWTGTSFATPKIAGAIAVEAGSGGTARQALARLIARSAGRLPGEFGVVVPTPTFP